jgi:hypothetical protein
LFNIWFYKGVFQTKCQQKYSRAKNYLDQDLEPNPLAYENGSGQKSSRSATLVLTRASLKLTQCPAVRESKDGHVERYQLQSYRFKPVFVTLIR